MFNPIGVIQALGGMANVRNQVNQFQQGLPQNGFDPKTMALNQAQQMLNTGKMTQQQYNNVLQLAGMISGNRTW